MEPIRSLSRGLEVLRVVTADQEPAGPSRVAAATGLDKATAARILHTLCVEGYLTRSEAGTYSATPRVLEFTRSFVANNSFVTLALPHLTLLRDRFDETVHLATATNGQVVYISKLETQRSIRLSTHVGQLMPLHSTGLGKAMLSALPLDRRTGLVRGLTLEAKTPATITDPDKLLDELEASFVRGYAMDLRENEENVCCAAAAIHDPDGLVVGALSISAPAFRVGEDMTELGLAVSESARAIAAELKETNFRPPVAGFE